MQKRWPLKQETLRTKSVITGIGIEVSPPDQTPLEAFWPEPPEELTLAHLCFSSLLHLCQP